MVDNLAIYIHWPFCKSKCPYCDFNSHVRDSIDIDKWKRAYKNAITNYAEILNGRKITSIFFGGGTPSLMPTDLVKEIIDNLKKLSIFDKNIEITLEANPTSVEMSKFREFANAGINRVSLGIQSFNSENLKFLGREHSANEAVEAINIAREVFKRYSFDLIYALPNQTLEEWAMELKQALKLADKHLSLYQLTIEKGTKFFSDYKSKKFSLPSDDLASDFYKLTQEIMNAHSLPAYEISNHASVGEECKHNLVYWTYGEFIGIGPGAHSRINNTEMHDIYHPEKWLNTVLSGESPIQNKNVLSDEEIISEILIMGLRLTKGLNLDIFNILKRFWI